MTEQSNDQFHASSFMQGHNAEYLEQLYARYANDPGAVDEAWQAFFRQMGDDEVSVKHEAAGPSWARADWPPQPDDDLTQALDGQWVEPAKQVEKIKAVAAKHSTPVSEDAIKTAVLDSIRALMLIRAYRIRGHLAADLDPLGISNQDSHPELDPRAYGFTDGRHGPANLPRQGAGSRIRVDARDRGHRQTHLLRHLRAAVHAHLEPRRGQLAQGADRGLRQGNPVYPRGPQSDPEQAGRGRRVREVPACQIHGHQAFRPRWR